MNSEMQRRLYDMEVTPPQAVWEKLLLNIDEINEDNHVANKVLNAELAPPASVWGKIDSAINIVEEKKPARKPIIINLRRLAAAAIIIGIIAAAWIIYQNNNSSTTALATAEEGFVKPNSSNNTGSVIKKTNEDNITNTPVDLSNLNQLSTQRTIASANVMQRENNRINHFRKNRNIAQSETVQYASLSKPLNKSFDQPIDDLSRVTSDQHYLTMVNSNGRLVRIPAELAHLASHLQDKPVSEDIYEVMFGEGTYWKETLSEWRKKVASVPVSSGDAFASLVELLKTVQNK